MYYFSSTIFIAIQLPRPLGATGSPTISSRIIWIYVLLWPNFRFYVCRGIKITIFHFLIIVELSPVLFINRS